MLLHEDVCDLVNVRPGEKRVDCPDYSGRGNCKLSSAGTGIACIGDASQFATLFPTGRKSFTPLRDVD